MKKVLVMVLLALVVPALVLAGCGKEVPAGAVAAVGDDVITQEAYDEIWAQAETQYAAQDSAAFPTEGTAEFKTLRASIMTYLVKNEVIAQKAAEMDVEVTAKELQTRVDLITTQVGGEKKLKTLLKQQSVTMDDLKVQLEDQMLQEEVQKKVIADVKVTDKAMRAYYDDADNKSQFVTEATVTARHILVKTKAEANEVRDLLLADSSDASWKKLAKEYSTDAGTKNSSGELGSFPKGRMVEAFEDVAFALEVGEISEPVKTQYGWHVIEVTDKTKGSNQTFEDAKATIEQTLLYQEQTSAWQKWYEQAEKDAEIAYAAGYNPVILTASPSPSASSSEE